MITCRLAALTLLLAVSAPAQDAGKFHEYADAAARIDQFSGTILLARKGVVLFEQSYGLADRKPNIPDTTATTFRIGSMTKPITATAIMLLRDRDRLKMDDSVCVYVAPCPAPWQPVKLTHLLTHNLGRPRYREVSRLPDVPHTAADATTTSGAHRWAADGLCSGRTIFL